MPTIPTTTRRARALAVTIGCLALLGAACGDDDDTRAASTTTTTALTTTTTAEPTTSTPDDGGAVPEGNGCAPGPGPLADGRWYGLAEPTGPGQLSFDLACWYTGDDAVAASAEDGEESPPPNDYYVRNEDPAERELAVAEGTTVEWYPAGDPASAETLPYAEWVEARTERDVQLAVWLDIEDGAVTSIEEQWVP